MPRLSNKLLLARCPHCKVANPHLSLQATLVTLDADQMLRRTWNGYTCQSCGGVVLAWAFEHGQEIVELFPTDSSVDDAIPERASGYLTQAIECMHAPAGAIMLCASAVDSMLKEKGYKTGSLYSRIDQAVSDHLITKEMGLWAHQIRLDANDERHADEKAALPRAEDAKRCIDFSLALGEFIFVLPSRITRGLSESKK